MHNQNHTSGSIGCDVTNCVYHGMDDMCQADSIQVESEKENCKSESETFCGTFEAKA